MTDAPVHSSPRLPSWRVLVPLAIFGAAVGAGMAMLPIRALSVSDVGALFIALSCLGAGLMFFWVSFDAGLMVRVLKFEGGASRAETASVRRTAVVMTLAGVLMAAPVFVHALGTPEPRLAWFAILALFLWQSWLNLKLWKHGDELQRRIILEGGALAFWSLQGLFFLYASAERIGLIQPISGWALMNLMMGGYLLASAYVGLRRTSTAVPGDLG